MSFENKQLESLKSFIFSNIKKDILSSISYLMQYNIVVVVDIFQYPTENQLPITKKRSKYQKLIVTFFYKGWKNVVA